MLQAYIAGSREKELAEEYDLTEATVKGKMATLELAFVKLGLSKSLPLSEKQNPQSSNKGIIAGPAPPAGTSMVLAGTQSSIIPNIQNNSVNGASQEGEEEVQTPE